MDKKKLVLIDGYNFLFRAFFAIRNLSRSDGLPTGALFGFTRMIMNVLVDIKCSHIAVVFDTGKKNFRHKLYPLYKANRPPAPEDLLPQFPLARVAVEALNVDIIEKVGFEADDIIATLAKKAEKEDFEVLIISSDKDLWQLVSDKVFIYDAMKKKKIGFAEVKEKWGVTPKELLDVLTLMGDSSDNVPGVAGIGPKTAALLVNTYGSVEDIIANADDIKQNKRRENIKSSVDKIKLSKKLITLDENVQLNIGLKDLTVKDLEPETFVRFLKNMEFFTIAKKIETTFGITVKEERKEEFDLFSDKKGSFLCPVKEEERLTKTGCGVSQEKSNENKTEEQSNKNQKISPSFLTKNEESQEKKTMEISSKIQSLKNISELQTFIEKAEHTGKLFLNIQTKYIKFDSEILSVTLSTEKNNSLFIKIKNEENEKKNGDLFIEKNDDEIKKEISFSFKEIMEVLKTTLEKKSILKIGFDVKKHIKILNEYDTKIEPIEDISVMSYILDAGLYSQKFSTIISKNFKNTDEKINQFIDILVSYEKRKNIEELVKEKLDFANFQIQAINSLYKIFKQRITDEKMTFIYEKFERPMTQVLAEMGINGMKVDITELNKLSSEFTKKIAILEKEIFEISGEEFNIGSPKQLGQILFKKLEIPTKKKSSKTGNFSTGIEILEDLKNQGFEIAKKVLEWRHFSKLKSTYTDSLPKQINKKTGRIHTTFSNITASTGRLSSIDPNLQNIPIRSEEGSKIRKSFIPKKGWKLISADYSQVELRVLANYAKVKELSKSFKEGKDVHTATASKVFEVEEKDVTTEMRRTAKAINFSIVYGTSAYGLAKRIKSSYADAKLYIENYFKLYPEIKDYMEKSKEFAKENGFVKSLFGRKCHINMKAKGPMRGFAERLAINAPMQGTAADIIKKATIDLHNELKKINSKAKIVLQIHDEIILEVPKDETENIAKLLKKTMEQAVIFDVPLTVEVGIGDNWSEIH